VDRVQELPPVDQYPIMGVDLEAVAGVVHSRIGAADVVL